MSTYPSIKAYTADVERACEAYRADQAVRAGLCAVCKVLPRDLSGRHRRCRSCIYRGRREGAV